MSGADMAPVIEAEVSQAAADFLKVEGREAALILGFLAARPVEWQELLWRAEWEAKIDSPIVSYGADVDPNVMVNRERMRVNAWLKLARFGYCERCFSPSVLYPNGLLVDWPAFGEHACSPVTDDATLVRRQSASGRSGAPERKLRALLQ